MRWLGCLFALLVVGCAPAPAPQATQEPALPHIALESVVQNLDYTLTKDAQERFAAAYRQKHFGIWGQKIRSDWSWAVQAARKNPGIGENLLPNDAEWIESLLANADLESAPTWQAAVVVADSALRLMPTHKPYFLPATIAGEGYPFDHWQNSAVFASTPVIVERTSTDGAWLLVHASFVSGWIESRNVAFVRKNDQERMRSLALFVPTTDDVALHSASGLWLDGARVGKVFVGQATKNGIVAQIPQRGTDGFVVWAKTKPTQQLQSFPLDFTQQNVQTIAAQLLGEKYGWGGLLGNRDCSAMLRDFWGSFGLWLPRNSSAQAQVTQGEALELGDVAPHEKERLIIEKGRAWGSLLWLSGHIVLYVGEVEQRAIVFHNLWGLRVLEDAHESRAVIGRSVLSDLWLGQELPNRVPDMLLIDRIATMRTLFAPDDIQTKEETP
ncbi:MAG: SH3 domain-containing protein [Helicobacter sp.]|nr:SH3 domain-containing protein [Helicobacter sp.]